MPSHFATDKKASLPKSPRLERGHARVAALKAAARAVFEERGYEAATMTEIAERADASIGSLYQFFPTKTSLAAVLHREMLDDLSRRIGDERTTATARPAPEVAQGLFVAMAGFLELHPAFPELASRTDLEKDRKQETRALLRAQIAELLLAARPPVPSERAEILAVLILELMKVVVSVSREDGVQGRDAVISEIQQMLVSHLIAVAP